MRIGADGGETSLRNLVQLCRYHHRLVHEGGFTCEQPDDTLLVFRDQVGEVIDSAGYSPPTDYDLAEWMRNKLEDLHIDAETCVPQWYAGDVMDYDLAVSSLFQCADPTLERATDKHMLI